MKMLNSTKVQSFVLLLILTFSSVSFGQDCTVHEPPLPGVLPGRSKPKIILAQDVNYPPYAFLSDSVEDEFGLTGFGHDIAQAMNNQCDLEVYTVQTSWDKCWDAGAIGAGLSQGFYHGCMTYTRTRGERNRYLEFSDPILKDNKPAGILTRLVNGRPVISPTSNLTGVKIVDVKGWAPTSDGLAFVKNSCTGSNLVDYEVFMPEESGNDAALKLLLDGTADGMFVYADQAYNYRCDDPDLEASWDCDLWSGFGEKFAYIHTGMVRYALSGTTLSISKKGSGVAEILNPCINKILQSKKYYYACKKYDLMKSCYPNSFFPNDTGTVNRWDLETVDQSKGCSNGYCSCEDV